MPKQNSEHLICRILDVSTKQTHQGIVYVIEYVEVGDIDEVTGDEYLNRKMMYLRSIYNDDKPVSDAQLLGYRGHLVDIRMSKGKIYSIRELD